MSLLHLNFSNIILEASGTTNLADGLPQPLINLLVGLGIIFAALVFIAGLVSIFKSISNLSNISNNNPNAGTPEPVNTVNMEAGSSAGTAAEEDLSDDMELVAVITAAIMASMGEEAPADGLVVRSIRRVNKRWQNA